MRAPRRRNVPNGPLPVATLSFVRLFVRTNGVHGPGRIRSRASVFQNMGRPCACRLFRADTVIAGYRPNVGCAKQALADDGWAHAVKATGVSRLNDAARTPIQYRLAQDAAR